jgi:hypothetical protein
MGRGNSREGGGRRGLPLEMEREDSGGAKDAETLGGLDELGARVALENLGATVQQLRPREQLQRPLHRAHLHATRGGRGRAGGPAGGAARAGRSGGAEPVAAYRGKGGGSARRWSSGGGSGGIARGSRASRQTSRRQTTIPSHRRTPRAAGGPQRRACSRRVGSRAACTAPRGSPPAGGGTRRVRLVREEGRDVSSQYGRKGGGGRPAAESSVPRASSRCSARRASGARIRSSTLEQLATRSSCPRGSV